MLQEGLELPHDVVGSHDILRHGLPAFKNDALPVHPVEVIQRTVCSVFRSLCAVGSTDGSLSLPECDEGVVLCEEIFQNYEYTLSCCVHFRLSVDSYCVRLALHALCDLDFYS